MISEEMKINVNIKSLKNRTRPSKSEVFRLCGSNKKAKKIMNWSPVYAKKKGFKVALRQTMRVVYSK